MQLGTSQWIIVLICGGITLACAPKKTETLPTEKKHAPVVRASRSGEEPEEVLKRFVKDSFHIKTLEDFRKLSKLTTRTAQKTLEGVTQDQIDEFYKNKKLDFIDFAVSETKKVDDETLDVEYRVAYFEEGPEHRGANFDNAKHATLVLDDGEWRVAKISHVSTSLFFKDSDAIQVISTKFGSAPETEKNAPVHH